jgi:hypothetical protein
MELLVAFYIISSRFPVIMRKKIIDDELDTRAKRITVRKKKKIMATVISTDYRVRLITSQPN